MCGGTEDAQDVVQDAFVLAYTKLSSFQRQSAFYTWLYRIAVNLLISRKRRTKLAVSLDERHERGIEPIDGQARPTAALESRDRIEQVRAALLALPDEQRRVIVLREIEGWPYETIAEVLDLPIGTVRSRLHRARMELREMLQEAYDEDVK